MIEHARHIRICRHVAKGGSEGADEPPFFSDQKKKVDGVRVWQLRVPDAIAPACTAVALHVGLHGPEKNLESNQLFSFSSDKDRRTDSRIRRKKHSAAPPIFVGAEREELIRNDPDKSEFTILKVLQC